MRVKKTCHGFEIIEFSDIFGVPCSLQQSSLAKYVKPGTSGVWFGPDNDRPRANLDRRQVKALIAHLQAWLDTGSFKLRRDR